MKRRIFNHPYPPPQIHSASLPQVTTACAINFLKRFNDISLLADLLGHDSIETTRIYLMKSSQEQQTVIDRVVTW